MTRRDPTPQDADPPCREDPDLFFDETGNNSGRREVAVSICRERCPHLDRCLAYAVTHQVTGVWGGTTDEERRAIRKERRIVPVPLSMHLPRDVYRGVA